VSKAKTWLLEGATQDAQSTDADWAIVGRTLIDGVSLREVRNVPKGNGMITEVFRRDRFDREIEIDQVFQAVVESHCVSAWHAHEHTVDRLFVNLGLMRVVRLRRPVGFADRRVDQRDRDGAPPARAGDRAPEGSGTGCRTSRTGRAPSSTCPIAPTGMRPPITGGCRLIPTGSLTGSGRPRLRRHRPVLIRRSDSGGTPGFRLIW